MKPELEKILLEKYPKIFVDCSKSSRESAMAFGLEIGDGWYEIMDALCETVSALYSTSAYIDEEGAKKFSVPQPTVSNFAPSKPTVMIDSPKVVFVQVKEKFGALRIYYRLEFAKVVEDLWAFRQYPSLETTMHNYSSVVDGAIRFAETLSLRTCEQTGTPGSLSSRNGWLKVLCPERATELGFVPYAAKPEECL